MLIFIRLLLTTCTTDHYSYMQAEKTWATMPLINMELRVTKPLATVGIFSEQNSGTCVNGHLS